MVTECVIIGANGLVGRHLGHILTKQSLSWVGTYHKREEAKLQQLNITDERAVKNLISRHHPKVVFHCANLAGGVNVCENEPAKAKAFHLTATQHIGEACKAVGAKLIFISTDYVFDGTRGPYAENDTPHPLNLYGKLKLQAEHWIQERLENYVIARTTNVYGWDPKTVTPNYLMGLYQSLTEGKSVTAPAFLSGQPTYAPDLAGALVELYQKDATGLFHIVGPTLQNRYEWAMAAAKKFGWNRSKIAEKTTAPENMIPRPLTSHLDCRKFTEKYETPLHTPEEGMELMKREMTKEIPDSP